MRKIIYTLTSTLLFICISCNDFLETDSESKLTDKTVFVSTYYAESAVLGIYDRIADAQMYAQRISINWSTNTDIEFVGADEKSYNQNTNRGPSNYYSTPGNSTLLWTRIYQMIERSNLVIRGIEKSPLMDGTDREKKTMQALLGEALTMRALGYYELVKLWGDVPFKNDPTNSDLSNVFLAKVDRDTIYDHMIKDLEIAEKYVPWVGESIGSLSYSTSERISKGFIKGLLARVALSRGGYSLRDKPGYPTERGSNWKHYYEIAHKHCKDVIEAGVYTLKPNYLTVWKDICALKTDGRYGENMYEVALGLGQSGEIGYSIGVRFYTNNKYGYGNNSNVVNTSAYYFYSFDKQDTRRDATIATTMYSNSIGDVKEFFQANPLSYNFAKWDQRWMSENATWLSFNKGANGKWGYGVNWVVMRYSDVLLMFAETENELNGPTDQAKSALKQVRNRAFAGAKDLEEKTTIYVNKLSSQAEFFEAIVNERAWEFGGEGIRKFDLIRWNLLVKKIQQQRDAFNNLISGISADIFDKKYSSLPLNIYYKYKDDKENIDNGNINFYDVRTDLDAMSDADLKTTGYTRVKWMQGFSDDNKKNYLERVKLFSSGLLKEYNGVCDNRYLYPIHSSVIGDYQGVVLNSYGY